MNKFIEKLKEIWYRFYDKFLFPIENFFYHLGVIYQWYWRVLRHDQDWDWTHICIVLKYKLERTRKCLEQGHHLRADRDARQIRMCEILLERIEKDEYHENAFREHEKKWGEIGHTWEPTDNPNLTRMILNRKNVKTPKDDEQEHIESKRLYTHENYMAKQDIAYLGKLLTKYLRNWWD